MKTKKAFKGLILPDFISKPFRLEPWMVTQANKTSRSFGAVGRNAVVPRKVRELFSARDNLLILDFGAGKDALHASALRQDGYRVDAYEFGDNVRPFVHTRSLAIKYYDVVYASNVLNVQANDAMMSSNLLNIWLTLKTGGSFVANFPLSPRKNDVQAKDLLKLIEGMFGEIKILKGGKAPVFVATKKS